MSYSKILVTGGAGFVGSHIVDRLISEGLEVTVLDNLSSGIIENIANKQVRFIKGDIRDYNLLTDITKNVDAVFHEAAIISVTQSIQNPFLTNEVNITGTLNLLKACLNNNVKRFIFASSAAVYGVTSTPEMNENMATNPISPYGVSKLTGEGYLRSFYNTYGLETVALRYFNIFGPRQAFNIQAQYGGVISIFLGRLCNNMPPVVYGDGEQTRDFIYIKDIVEANILALNSKKALGETINIGSGKRISINYLAQVLKELTGKTELKNVYTDTRPGDVKHGYADITKAKNLLDYKPTFSFEDGLASLVKWYLKK